MKEKLSLLDVCKLPDVQLHSKKALFKAIVSKESSQSQEMKEQIVSLSYTIKTIGVQGQEVGISSKRIPLKFKKKQDMPPTFFAPNNNYLAHQSFFAQALVPVKKQKEKTHQEHDPLQVMSNKNTIHIETGANYDSQSFKIRAKSMAQMRTSKNFPKEEQNLQDFGRVKGMRRVSSAVKKKSFSNMLKECTAKKAAESINPLMHEQNPLFKKIKRIKSVYPKMCEVEMQTSSSPFKRVNSKFSSSSNLLRHYRQQL